MSKVRKLYSSLNGDRWYLIRDASGEIFVRHEANLASGGHVAHIEIGTFLSSGRGPEHQELLRLIGTSLDTETAHDCDRDDEMLLISFRAVARIHSAVSSGAVTGSMCPLPGRSFSSAPASLAWRAVPWLL